MIQAALLCAIVYFVVGYGDECWLSWQCLTRPIVVAPITGLVLGDVTTGIIMGASLESIFMGISAIGGAVPSDAFSASIIAVAYTILTGASAEEGLAIAMPIGTVMASFNALAMSVVSSPLAPHWEKLAAECNPKKFDFQVIGTAALLKLIPTTVLFLAIAFGVEGLNAALAALPSFIMTGLSAASSMMTGVGFAILTSMIWDKEIAVFFFVGYVLAAYLSLSTLAIAIIGVAIAVTMFFNQKKLIELENKFKAAPTTTTDSNDEEDFF